MKRFSFNYLVLTLAFTGLNHIYAQNAWNTDPCVSDTFIYPSPPGQPDNGLCEQEYEDVDIDKISELSGLTQYVGKNLHIYKDLEIDNNFIFKNCNLKFELDVKLIIAAGKKLELDHSNLFTCENLWEGIQVNNDATIKTYNNTEISDAKNAINRVGSNTKFSLKNTTFSNNKICLLLKAPLNAINKPEFLDFFKLNFVCNRFLRGTSIFTFAGIYLENYSFWPNTPLYSSAKIEFIGLNYGIIQETGKLRVAKIQNFSFSKIYKDAIKLESCYLSARYCTFTDCSNGITVNNVQVLSLNSSKFYYFGQISGTSISTSNLNINSQVSIDYNYFEQGTRSTKRANFIVMGSNRSDLVNSNSQILIKHNQFWAKSIDSTTPPSFKNPGATCVAINYLLASNTVHWHIDTNKFYLSNSCVAIGSLGQRNNFTIEGNEISAAIPRNNLAWSEPIKVLGNITTGQEVGENNVIRNNRILSEFNIIDSLFYPSNVLRGFSLYSSRNFLVCNNYVENAYQEAGYYFQDDCSDTKFIENSAFSGVFIQINGWIGSQIFNGNYWLLDGMYLTPRWNPLVLCKDTFEARFSKFEVTQPRSDSGIVWPKHPPRIVPLFIPNTNTEWWEYKNETDNNCPYYQQNIVLTSIDSLLLIDSIISPNPATTYQLKSNLYAKLLNNSNTIGGSYLAANWISTSSQNTLIDEIDTRLSDLINLGNSDPNLGQNQLIMDTLLDKLNTIIDDTLVTDTSLFMFTSYLDILSNNSITHASFINTALNSIQSQLNLSGNNANESVALSFMNIYVNYLLNGVTSQAEITRLLEIANLCTKDYGVYPYWANQLLPWCQHIPNFVHDCNYGQNQIKKGGVPNKPSSTKFVLYNLQGIPVLNCNEFEFLQIQHNLIPGVYIKYYDPKNISKIFIH